jgi:serpin B
MTLAGAAGETAAEIRDVLHYPAAGQTVHEAAGALQDALVGAVPDPRDPDRPAFRLSVANRLWVQQGFSLRDRFLGLCRDRYGAGVGRVDFQRRPEDARQEINDWVSEQTAHKITDLLPPSAIDPLTALVLTNAVHFLAQWAEPFEPERTDDRPFHVPGMGAVDVPTMRQSETFAYAADDDVQFLRLPYSGGRQVCEIILPRAREGLADLTADLTRTRLQAWREAARSRLVDLELPRFDIEARLELADLLAELGMPSAFRSGRADFSAMTADEPLVIDRVIHQAVVTMDEAGTEAAAATAITMLRSSVREPGEVVTFRADHPFLFLVRDEPTGAVLFVGRVVDPRG